ncbi:MAG: hypothetical protein COA42_06705 [Alteromonadaceae bacterium]|nr:MAG: hypothetical protein COA42_06705 [Alteromonadaceae bacterium]
MTSTRTLISTITALVFIFSSMHIAAEVTNTNLSEQIKSAQGQVDKYKSLRLNCANAKGASQKQCYRKLNAATGDYKAAKRLLGEA